MEAQAADDEALKGFHFPLPLHFADGRSLTYR